MKAKAPKVATRENPLVPFALMKRMYAGMVQIRLLEIRLAKRSTKDKRLPLAGQEACRAAVLFSLQDGDLVADSAGAAGSAWLQGADLADVVRGSAPGLLPVFDDAAQQAAVALGAAAAINGAKPSRVVVVFLDAAMKLSALRQAFSVAAGRELPILFVLLPPVGPGAVKGFAAAATKLGVPGIPVEAQDAVALCRVAQESILRARAGGGPALIECVRLEAGKRAADPVAAMAKTLLRVGACDREWLDSVAPAFQNRLKALKQERPG